MMSNRAEPRWRQAAAEFAEADHKPGAIFTHKEIADLLWLEFPTDEMPYSRANKLRLRLLTATEAFVGELLNAYQLHLANERAVGWRLLPAAEATGHAMKAVKHELRRVLRTGLERVSNVDHSQLTPAQAAENRDAIARFSQLRSFVRREILPPVRRKSQ